MCLPQTEPSQLSRPSYQCFFQVVKYLAEAAASGVNVVMKYLAQFLMAAGVDGKQLGSFLIILKAKQMLDQHSYSHFRNTGPESYCNTLVSHQHCSQRAK